MYQPDPKLEQLRAQQERDQKKLEQLQHRAQRLQNRINYLESAERRQRNHRLITRGAVVEHLWPEVKPLSEHEYYVLMEQITNLSAARSILQAFLYAHPKEDDG